MYEVLAPRIPNLVSLVKRFTWGINLVGIVFFFKYTPPLPHLDLFELDSTQVEKYDEGFKYLMHEECM